MDEKTAMENIQIEEISFKYTMSEKEVYDASIFAGIFEIKNKTMKYVLTAACALAGVYNVVMCFLSPEYAKSTLTLAVICAALIAFLWLMPVSEMKKRARNNAFSRPIPVQVSDEKILIDEGEKQWFIKYDDSFSYKENDEFMVIFSRNGRIVAFPKRDIGQDNLDKMKSLFETKV